MKFVLSLSNGQSAKHDGDGDNRIDCKVQTIGDTNLHCCNYITHGRLVNDIDPLAKHLF